VPVEVSPQTQTATLGWWSLSEGQRAAYSPTLAAVDALPTHRAASSKHGNVTHWEEQVELTVVLPCLNEAATLAVCIEKVHGVLRDHSIAGEVVVADNGSSDGSPRIAEERGARVVSVPIRGYGSALAGGIRAARGRFIIMGDADDSYDFADIPRFLERLHEGCDLVIGNRFAGGIKPGAMPFLHRYLGNPVLSFLGRLFFRCSIHDFHCGLRGVSREAATRMDLRTTGMEFASEMVIKASLHGMRLAEVPTTLAPDGRSRPPHLRRWRDGWRHLRLMLIYSPRWALLYPGLTMIAAGAVVLCWLLPGPQEVGGVTFDVHTLLYGATLLLVGFQAVSFALIGKLYAVTVGLMPSHHMNRFFRSLTLELGLLAGGMMILLGLILTGVAISEWAAAGLGGLDYSRTMRIVIPAVLALTLGCHVIVSSLVLSLLGDRHR